MAHKTELLMRHSSINYLEVLAARLEKPRDFDPFGQTGFAHLWLQYD